MKITRERIQLELERWFGPSPMSAPLHLRIWNRGLMETSHRAILAGGYDGSNDKVIYKPCRKGYNKDMERFAKQLTVKHNNKKRYLYRKTNKIAFAALNSH